MQNVNFDWLKINHDINGNPRYLISYIFLGKTIQQAKVVAKRTGGKLYRGKSLRCGFVYQSYNLRETENFIKEIQSETT